MSVPNITYADARRALIAAQGLNKPISQPASKEAVRAVIRQMNILQIDTISVVARSPYFVLWSRLGHYDPLWLEELLAEGHLFEYWAHAACFLPIEDYPYFRRRMMNTYHSEDPEVRYASTWMNENAEAADAMLTHIRANGAVRSSDFERTTGKSSGWWDWKTEKVALEVLWNVGELMVARRQSFQRVYDLRERILPDWDDVRAPSTEEMDRVWILNTVKALGVAKASWADDYYRLPKKRVVPMVKKLADEGALRVVNLTSDKGTETAYVHPDNWHLIENPPAAERTTLLMPFDPIVWDRVRALDLFNFDYRIECYTPAAKRIYGYFTLPILWKDQLAGRIDAKAHRKEGRFEVKALHLEPGVPLSDELAADLAATLRDCAVWHKTPTVEITRSEPPAFADQVRRAL